jgi:hypothetical protein
MAYLLVHIVCGYDLRIRYQQHDAFGLMVWDCDKSLIYNVIPAVLMALFLCWYRAQE